MNKNNNNTSKNNNKTIINTKRKRRNRLNRNRVLRRRINRIKRQIVRRRRGTMAAAYTRSVPRTFNTMQLNGTSAVVAGTDLIYKIPTSINQNNGTSIITMIPANPAYWTGTRIATIAQGYQNYRPIIFKIHYIPQCAVTQQGNVLAGTLWNEVPSEENLQQTLKTSNGGILTQCYKPAISNVRMKTNLQYNLYRMGGQINQQSNPFIYIAMQIGCTNVNGDPIVPGYFYISYKYILKNPIGTGIIYKNSGITSIDQNYTFSANAVAYTLKTVEYNNITIPPGTRLDIEKGENAYELYYNDTKLGNAAEFEDDPLWLLQNQPIPINNNNNNQRNFLTNITYTALAPIPGGQATLLSYDSRTYESLNHYVTLINVYSNPAEITLPTDMLYRTTIPNDFGPLTQFTNGVMIFEAPKHNYNLVSAHNNDKIQPQNFVKFNKIGSKNNSKNNSNYVDEDDKEDDKEYNSEDYSAEEVEADSIEDEEDELIDPLQQHTLDTNILNQASQHDTK